MAECCSAAHNLEIVRNELNRAQERMREQERELEDLRAFKKLVMLLTKEAKRG